MQFSRILSSGLVSMMLAGLGLAACGSSSTNSGSSTATTSTGTGGTGGSTNTGGSPGTGGSLGTGGSTASGCAACYPQCVIDAFADCDPTDACTTATVGLMETDTCYANGVKEKSTISDAMGTTTFYKTDGSVCVTAFATFTTSGATYAYKDGSGNALFSDEEPLAGGQKITCNGTTVTIDASSTACQACEAGYFSNKCPSGACTVP